MITLFDRTKMLELLMNFKNDGYLAEKFYSLLLQFAGQDMTPEVFVMAVNKAMKAFLDSLDKSAPMTNFVYKTYENLFISKEFDIMDCMAPKDDVMNICNARLKEMLAHL